MNYRTSAVSGPRTRAPRLALSPQATSSKSAHVHASEGSCRRRAGWYLQPSLSSDLDPTPASAPAHDISWVSCKGPSYSHPPDRTLKNSVPTLVSLRPTSCHGSPGAPPGACPPRERCWCPAAAKPEPGNSRCLSLHLHTWSASGSLSCAPRCPRNTLPVLCAPVSPSCPTSVLPGAFALALHPGSLRPPLSALSSLHVVGRLLLTTHPAELLSRLQSTSRLVRVTESVLRPAALQRVVPTSSPWPVSLALSLCP